MPSISLPIAPTPTEEDFVIGTGFGFVQEGDGSVRFHHGVDVWLPEGRATIHAVCKGTLRFVPAGQPVEPEVPELAEMRALGDTLVLKAWPKEHLQLQEILGEARPAPRFVYYHNVDRASALRCAKQAIRRTPGSLATFRQSLDTPDVSDAAVESLIDRWVDEVWSTGQATAILVAAGDEIGTAAAPAARSPYLGGSDPIPTGADANWRVVTLGMADEHKVVCSAQYVFYLIATAEAENWTDRLLTSDPFVARAVADVRRLPLVELTTQLRVGWQPGDPPDDGMPVAFPTVKMLFERVGTPGKLLPALFDPGEDKWRMQGAPVPGEYQWSFKGPMVLAQCNPNFPRSAPAPAPPRLGLVAPSTWLSFDTLRGRREYGFILGVNMEACRWKHKHDLGPNDITYSVNGSAVNLESPLGSEWLTGNVEKLKRDLRNIAATGARVIRVWAFEYFEGLRFNFTEPRTGAPSLLNEARQNAQTTGTPLKRHFFQDYQNDPGADHVIFSCTAAEFSTISSAWGPLRVSPPTNEIFQRLLQNARTLQQEAATAGLGVLWSLWTHYGEGDPPVDPDDVIAFTSDASHGSPGRLSIDAWIYRAMMVEDQFRRSYIDNAVKPFVRDMEAAAGDVLGYEVMNEADINWDGCTHSWTAMTTGGAAHPTNWKLSAVEVRRFIKDCADAIADSLPPTQRTNRLILCGVLGSEEGDNGQWVAGRSTQNEVSLIQPRLVSAPNVDLTLSATALTRYGTSTWWRQHTPDLAAPTSSWLLQHGNACLFIEAGDNPRRKYGAPGPLGVRVYNDENQRDAVSALLTAAMQKGFAGVFVWHYNNPERTPEGNDPHNDWGQQNALIEACEATTPRVPPHDGHNYRFTGGRQAVERIHRFAHDPSVAGVLYPRP